MPALPMLPSCPSCPAALAIAGASDSQRGVVCREMQLDQEADAGVAMNPAQLERLREGEGGAYLNLKGDPSSVVMFCHGSAVPVVTDEDGQGRASYTYCPTWQQARNRRLAGLRGLTDPVEPESVSMGMPEPTSEQTVEAARRDLAELVPAAGRRGVWG